MDQDTPLKVDLSQIPLKALQFKTLKLLSDLLNPERVIPNEEGLPRDWRGLHGLANLPVWGRSHMPMGEDPTLKVLQMWIKQASPSVADLQNFLGKLDRWDVVDDTSDMIDTDAKEHLLLCSKPQHQVRKLDTDVDQCILTRDDIHRVSSGLPAQNYDALLLYADEDEEFALQMIKKLEEDYKLKLCVKERDLIGGFCELNAMMTLIAERCNRLIVILSPNFINSEANKFFVTYAQALGIEQRQRKVVPCLYQRCQIPSQLSHCFLLDYNRSGKLFDFWGKLKDSVEPHYSVPSLPPPLVVPTLAITDGSLKSDHVRCTVEEITDTNLSSQGHTALVCLSDPSTLYPPFRGGDNNNDADKWHPSKPEAVSANSSTHPSPKTNMLSSTFLGKWLPNVPVNKVKPKRKWFSKKKAVALENS